MANSKILVIDDSRVIRKTVRDMLPEGDFEVIEAKDGLEGIDCVQKELPSLIMLDFILPKMSGWDVFQQIQAHPEFQKIPLVLMSGKKEEVTSKIAEPFEYFEFIEKPFDRAILAEAIRSAMTKSRKARPRIADLPGASGSATERQASSVSNDEISQLQERLSDTEDRLVDLQTTTSAEIQALKAQIAAVQESHQDEIAALTAKFEAHQQERETLHQSTVEKFVQLESEVDTLKKQLSQLVVLIKKKLASGQ